jgi:putative NADH-flavin reductase
MKFVVFGATGGTGRQLVSQALDAGHEVTAVVRDPARLPVSHPALRVVTTNVTDADSLGPVLAGHDVVLSALGAPTNKQAGIASAGHAAIMRALEAAEAAGTIRSTRCLVVSGSMVGPPPDDEPFLVRHVLFPIVHRVYRDIRADLQKMEDVIRGASGVTWTLFRPPRLVDRPLTGRYRVTIGSNVRGGRTLSRADLAHAMLAMIDDQATVKQIVGIAY